MVELQTKDFSTRSCNVWKSDEMSLYPESGSCGDPDSDAEFDDQEDLQQKYARVEQNTSSLYCPQANLVAPFVNNDSAKTQLMQDMDGDGQHDVILEKDENGDTFLHLVMPASAVNFLNGHDGNSLSTS